MENILNLPSGEVMCTFFDEVLSYITVALNPCLSSCSFWLMTSSDMEMCIFPLKELHMSVCWRINASLTDAILLFGQQHKLNIETILVQFMNKNDYY